MTAVTSYFPLAGVIYETSTCNEQRLCQMWHICTSWRQTFPHLL